ncbi:GSCOCG00005607001-RA-CDS [Cotesia congregata]|nr:GSCOCG00005607001-RA-CDS [Cotesia congregata]
MRLRPPLVGTAGTSADSGTGDSASAEIQVEALGSLMQTPGDNEEEDNEEEDNEDEYDNLKRDGPRSGKQTVKPFTKESLDRLESRTVQLVREYGFQPRRKTSVEDGAVLPNKFEPFPSGLYGRPLEEIDNFIYDEVRYFFY